MSTRDERGSKVSSASVLIDQLDLNSQLVVDLMTLPFLSTDPVKALLGARLRCKDRREVLRVEVRSWRS